VVNGGTLKICEVFLCEGCEAKFGTDNVVTLARAMNDFVQLCGFAIKLNASLITSKYQKFQEMVEHHYDILKTAVSRYTALLGQRWDEEHIQKERPKAREFLIGRRNGSTDNLPMPRRTRSHDEGLSEKSEKSSEEK
jgi:hypothetical protein